jgi:AcrR family transcriptional regulator
MGTLHRHFPTKDDPLATVLEQALTSWLTTAHQTALTTEDPRQALTGFVEQILANQARNHAPVESYAATVDCAPYRDSVLDDLRTPCLKAGLLRPDVTTADLVLLLTSLSQTVQTIGDSHPGQWHRLLRISLDGLSGRNTEPLPEPAPHEGTPRSD